MPQPSEDEEPPAPSVHQLRQRFEKPPPGSLKPVPNPKPSHLSSPKPPLINNPSYNSSVSSYPPSPRSPSNASQASTRENGQKFRVPSSTSSSSPLSPDSSSANRSRESVSSSRKGSVSPERTIGQFKDQGGARGLDSVFPTEIRNRNSDPGRRNNTGNLSSETHPHGSRSPDNRPSQGEKCAGNTEKPQSKKQAGHSKVFNGFVSWSRNAGGYTLSRAKIGAKGLLNKRHLYSAYLETQDDYNDALASQEGEEGLCSRCKTFESIFVSRTEAVKQRLGWASEWASPLSRILLNSNWCLLCGLILNTMCDPEFDPLLHPAVAKHIQPHLRGSTMKSWAEEGWESNDRDWPFGHNEKRHGGAKHVLSNMFEELDIACLNALRVIRYQNLKQLFDPKTSLLPDGVLREALRRARNPNHHPISCVVKITRPDPNNRALLAVNMWGFSRERGADLQVLSSFRLRLARQDSGLFQALSPYKKLLDPDWIDPSVARDWLKECDERHGIKCKMPGWATTVERPAFIRVIDVVDCCVKEATNPQSCRFLALSYVWGKTAMVFLSLENVHRLTRKNGLRPHLSEIPRTIVDAIEVVRTMGERYLWVDALCIVQDGIEKEEQIRSMDRIFSSAIATLVAADGITAKDGLVGIRGPVELPEGKPRELSQRWAKINDNFTVTAPLSTRNYDIDGSIWNSRGWTYQERLLSRRLIIFTRGEIIWHCREMSCREDLPGEESSMPLDSFDWISLRRQHFEKGANPLLEDGWIEYSRHNVTRLVRPSSFVQYAKAVEQYTHRRWTHTKDILLAFEGLSHIFSMCFKSQMIFGLPEKFLDFALLWRPAQRLTRREGFPSWSWSGWTGQVVYNKTFRIRYDDDGNFQSYTEREAAEEGIRPLIRWHVWREAFQRLDLINNNGIGFPYPAADRPNDWEQGPSCLHDNGFVLPITPRGVEYPIPSKRVMSRSCLYFWASTASDFHIGHSILQESDAQWNANLRPRRFEIHDRNSHRIGNVLVDGSEDEWLHHQ